MNTHESLCNGIPSTSNKTANHTYPEVSGGLANRASRIFGLLLTKLTYLKWKQLLAKEELMLKKVCM